MREIKFRAWHKNHQVMIPLTDFRVCGEYSEFAWSAPEDSEYYGICNLPDGCSDFTLDGDMFNAKFKDIYVLMQYTGLKDKNGKEIYEGDILKTMWQHDGVTNYDYEMVGAVVWRQEDLQFQLHKEHETGSVTYPLASFEREELDDENVEVIGNIYENPELLK